MKGLLEYGGFIIILVLFIYKLVKLKGVEDNTFLTPVKIFGVTILMTVFIVYWSMVYGWGV